MNIQTRYVFKGGNTLRSRTVYEDVPMDPATERPAYKKPKRHPDGRAIVRIETLTQDTTVILEIDQDALDRLASKALRATGGRAQSGPVVAKRIGRLQTTLGPEDLP